MKRLLALLVILFATQVLQAQPNSILTQLHPRPQSSFLRAGGPSFTLTTATVIVISDSATPGTMKAVQFLERTVRAQIGDTIPVFRYSQFPQAGTPGTIMIGEVSNFPKLASLLTSIAPRYVIAPNPESYWLDVSASGLLLAGFDTSGVFYSVSTLAQLLRETHNTIPSLHIFDYPDYPIRWVFSMHNMMVLGQVASLEAIEDTMAAYKMNGLQQNDFKNNIYDILDNYYFSHVDSVRVHSAMTNVEIIPGIMPIGYSDGILFHDPDLAEGIPTTASYYIEGDTGRLVGDPNVSLPNGGFEKFTNGQFSGWSFYDGPNKSVFVDSTVFHSGRYSARCTSFDSGNSSGNCRFNKLLNCQPFHGYHMSVWIKTQGFRGDEVQLLAIGTNTKGLSQGLTFTQYSVPPTSGWQKYDVVFNTLTWDQVYVYCGVWGGAAGTIWFDDFQIEDAGMTNLMRRTSDMPAVTVAGKSTTFVEGRDYATLIDDVMEKNQGAYTWHASPGFKLLPGSTIHNGDTALVHFIRPNPVLNYQNGAGSTMVCVSEDTLYSIMHDQLRRVDAKYNAGKYFMSHDEIREMNWDKACTSRKLSPAALLADNFIKCDSIIKQVHPGAERFDWSDMFDTLHNAHNNYYLVNGDLTGDWDMIPRDVTIANWNGGNMKKSLQFFADHGFSQVTSPYYDVPNTVNIRDWRIAMEGVQNMQGMMYTTWAADYSYLTPFADYAWSAGPMIVHTPLDSTTIAKQHAPYPISADVFTDPYDPADSIVSVTVFARNGGDIVSLDTLHPLGNSHFAGTIVRYPYEYSLIARNKQGLSRIERVIVAALPGDYVSNTPIIRTDLGLFPNPANTILTVRFPNPVTNCSMEIVNSLGSIVRSMEIKNDGPAITIDIRTLLNGAYTVHVKTGAETLERSFVILR